MTKKMKTAQKTEKQLMQEFSMEYKILCSKYDMRIAVIPTWVARDDGSWSMVLQTSIEKASKKVLSN